MLQSKSKGELSKFEIVNTIYSVLSQIVPKEDAIECSYLRTPPMYTRTRDLKLRVLKQIISASGCDAMS